MSHPAQRRVLRSRASKSENGASTPSNSSPTSSSSSPSSPLPSSPTVESSEAGEKKERNGRKRSLTGSKTAETSSDGNEKTSKKSKAKADSEDSGKDMDLSSSGETSSASSITPATALSSAATFLAQLKETQVDNSDPKKLQTLLEPIYQLRHALASMFSKLPNVTASSSETSTTTTTLASRIPWGILISQYPEYPNLTLNRTPYTIGKSTKCDFVFKGADANLIAKLHFSYLASSGPAASIECCSNNAVSVNHQPLKNETVTLKSGDEIVFKTQRSRPCSFVFEFKQSNPIPVSRSNDNLSSALSSSSSAPSSPPITPIAALPTASSLPVVSSYMTRSQKRRSSIGSDSPIPVPSPIVAKLAESSNFLVSSSGELDALPGSPNIADGRELNSSSSKSSQKNGSTEMAGTTSLPSPTQTSPSTPTAATHSSTSAATSASSTNSSSPQDPATIKNSFREEFVKSILKPEDISVTLEAFPYYLSDDIKKILVNSLYIFLKKPDFLKFTAEIPSLSRRILLTGPSGTEIYQETIAKALAKFFNTNLLVFDAVRTSLDPATPPISTTSFSTINRPDYSSSTYSDTTSTEESDLSEMWGGSSSSSSSETSNKSTFVESNISKRSHRTFKKGDKVKYVGSSPPQPVNPIARHVPASAVDYSNGSSSPATSSASTTSATPGRRQDSHRGPYSGYKGKVVLTFEDNPRKVGIRFDKPIPGGVNLGNLCEDNHGFFVDTTDLKLDKDANEGVDAMALEVLFELVNSQPLLPCILFIKDVEKTILSSYDRYNLFKKHLDTITTAPIIIIGSSVIADRKEKSSSSGLLFSKSSTLLDFSLFDHLSRLEDRAKENSKASKVLNKMFPNRIHINPPQEAQKLTEWKKQIDEDVKRMKAETNKFNICKILEKSNIVCSSIQDAVLRDKVFTPEQVEKIVGWSVSNHLMTADNVSFSDDGKLSISARSIEYGAQIMLNSQTESIPKSLKDIEFENEFEKRLLSEVIPANEIGVHFDDIGALEKVKNPLRELVMLPLQRPELFAHGNLTKPCKGILLFGPPGTGKTMLAKAVATESGANFINVSMSTIGSKWFGEGEKYARAVFTLASKISPAVIFIDEVDSMLGKRERLGEHEAMRKIKNEFMSLWDGLKTKEGERVLVLAATNRPFDLDEAVLRRLPRRMLVDLPDAENREKILKVILAKERLTPDFPFAELAKMTEGFSGSDLKNLCISAAYMPIREIIEGEKKEKEAQDKVRKEEELAKQQSKGKEEEEATPMETTTTPNVDSGLAAYSSLPQGSTPAVSSREPVVLRCLTMADFEKAKREVRASVSEDAFAIAELRKWNEMYGEGGTKTHTSLSYFM